MRSWLNGYGAEANVCGKDYVADNFLRNAFTDAEQAAIRDTTVINEGNSDSGTEGGEDTTDKVYLLSVDEVTNPEYGFVREVSDSEKRKAMNTDYKVAEMKAKGILYAALSTWWLRSPGSGRIIAPYVSYDGNINPFGEEVYDDGVAVRPALHLNLSSVSEWRHAESVASPEWLRVETPAPGEAANRGLRNPVINSDGSVTWDRVCFGSYWQNDTHGDGTADKNDEKEPIKWRVLSVNGDDAFLLADKILDAQKYNDTGEGVTWETSTIRSWLNGYGAEVNACGKDCTEDNFLRHAFTDAEQAAIRDTVVINADDPLYGTDGGEDTTDKVYLLSMCAQYGRNLIGESP